MSFRIHVDRTATQIDDLLDSAGSLLFSPYEDPRDPLRGSYLQQQRLGLGGSIHYGRVHYSLPHIGWYRVAVDDGHGVLPCCSLSHAVSGLLGPRSHTHYPPGTGVLVQLYRQPVGLYGVVLGSIPEVTTNANLVMPDWLLQGSNVGVKREGYYTRYLTDLGDEGGAIDFSNSKPLDNLSFDWGVMTETGVGVHVDPFLSFLRVDEICGIWFHYQDQHTTLAGHSLDVVTGVSEIRYRDDEGETSYHLGEAAYPWELLGALAPETSPVRTVTDEDVHFNSPEAKLEPQSSSQQPFFRYEEYGGYLGQGRIRQMSIPANSDSAAVNSLTGPVLALGVFRETIGLGGDYTVASAKQVSLVKSTIFPVPLRKRLPEDGQEESDAAANNNYKASGYFGEGEPHQLADLQPPVADGAALWATATTLDNLAYGSNWKSLLAFHYHQGDFEVPEDGSTAAVEDLDLSDLEESMYLPLADGQTQQIDHRYAAKFRQLLSYFSLTDDGGWVLRGGRGEEIRAAGGAITISCPGNVFVQPGKSVVNLVGDDYVIRARNSVDISSSHRDIRIAASVNLHMLSGHSGEGGTLLENRSTSRGQDYPEEGGETIRSSGIVLKAANSLVSAMASEIYLRTGSNSIGSGPIVLDAGKGSQNVRIVAAEVQRFLRVAATDNFINSTGRVLSSNVFGPNTALISSQLGVGGALRINGAVLARGPMQLSDGHYSSQTGGPVGRLLNASLVRQSVQEGTELATQEQVQRTQDEYLNYVHNQYYAANLIGHQTVQQAISFGFRNEAQYNTNNFRLVQTSWQVAEQVKGQGEIWLEPDVAYQNQATQPWPGRRAWANSNGFLTLPPGNFAFYDLAGGHAKTRQSENYTIDPASFQPAAAATAYKVVKVRSGTDG